MALPSPRVQRLPHRLLADARRTITRFFWLGDDRGRKMIGRVLDLTDASVADQLATTRRDFADRHAELDAVLSEHFDQAARRTGFSQAIDDERRLLIGAYFTMEYAYESAALFNPSMVPSHEQGDVPPGSTRFVMSLRAVGEGHLSSIVFRTGVVDAGGDVRCDPVPPRARRLRMVEQLRHDRQRLRVQLIEIGGYSEPIDGVFQELGDSFTSAELEAAIRRAAPAGDDAAAFQEAADRLRWLARSNYQIETRAGMNLAELVLFPLSENESQGMEDMRLVCFDHGGGQRCYYGTYTAYNGAQILPQILEATPGRDIQIHTLSGRYAANKGIALFPRKVDDWYMMVARVDGENLYLVRSDNIRFWNDGALLQEPRFPWEFAQIGNCGSPIETDRGWLLLTHGVGPMRRYCIGASLLDRRDPSRVIGRTAEPLIMPLADERSGYVPNVVYSCGAMPHEGRLVIPYGISDSATGFATVDLAELLAHLSSA